MPLIRELELQLTHRCNLRCSYCYAGVGHDVLPSDLDPALVDPAIEFLLRHAGEAERVRVSLWGGEPLLFPELISQVAESLSKRAHALGKQWSIGIPTNVTLLTSSALELVRTWSIELSLSLDGLPAAHAWRKTQSGENSWSLIAPRLEALRAQWAGELPAVRMTVLPERAEYLSDDVKFLLDYGFRRLSFVPAAGVRWGECAVVALNQELHRIADNFIREVRARCADLPLFPPILRRLAPRWVKSKTGKWPRRAGTCRAGVSFVAVDTRGDLYPCHRVVAMLKPPAALRLGSLSQGFNNSELLAKLDGLSDGTRGARCANCAMATECGITCVADNYRETGDVCLMANSVCLTHRLLSGVAERIHAALFQDEYYAAYIQNYMRHDRDDRWLLSLGAIEADPDLFASEAEAMLVKLHSRTVSESRSS